jgi:hypothetical protein
MSISSHLTPEPERRLWLILESMRGCVERADRKTAALTAFAAAEFAFIKTSASAGPLELLALAILAASLPLGVFSFSPLVGLPKWLPFLGLQKDRPATADNLMSADDLAKYSHLELINRLDKYLGGGITATQYYEDIIGEIVVSARIAARKQRLFRVSCIVVGLGQLGLLGLLLKS